MEVDSDLAPQGYDNDNGLTNGLATSRHATAPQPAQPTQPAQPSKRSLYQPPRRPSKAPTTRASHPQQQPQALLQDLVALVPQDQHAVAQGLAKELLWHLRHYTAPARLDDASLKKVVTEGVREALVALSSPL